jgi:hypothetical protein
MCIIKEPKDVDFVVKSQEWTEIDRLELSNIIAKERRTMTPQQRKLVKELSASLNS